MAVRISDKLVWVRSHPIICSALACSSMVLLLIPQVLSVFIYFSPLLASTALVFVTALLNVGSSPGPCRECSDDNSYYNGEDEMQEMAAIGSVDKLEYDTRVLFESIFMADVKQSWMAVKEIMLEDMFDADRTGGLPLKQAKEISEVTAMNFQEGGSKVEIKVAEHLISSITDVDMEDRLLNVKKEDPNDTFKAINVTNKIDASARTSGHAIDDRDSEDVPEKKAAVSIQKLHRDSIRLAEDAEEIVNCKKAFAVDMVEDQLDNLPDIFPACEGGKNEQL